MFFCNLMKQCFGTKFVSTLSVKSLGGKNLNLQKMSPTPDQRPNWDRRRKQLDPEAKQALGNLSPELAWLELQDQVTAAIVEHFEEAQRLANSQGWKATLGALPDALLGLSPVFAVKLFVESNPDFNLQSIPYRNRPLEVLNAMFEMLLHNESLQV